MAPPLTSLCNALHIRLAKVGFVDATGHVGRVLHEVLVVVTTQDLVNAHKVELHRHVVGFIAAERCVCVCVCKLVRRRSHRAGTGSSHSNTTH